MTPRSRTFQPRRARARLTNKKRKYIWDCQVMGCEAERSGKGYEEIWILVLVRRLLIGTGGEELGEECLQEGQAWLKVRKTRSSDARLTRS